MGGEGIQGFAELLNGGQHHRSKPCACRSNRRSAARDGPFAPAGFHSAHLQSRGLAPDPPTGRSRDVRRRPAKSRAAGVTAGRLRAPGPFSANHHDCGHPNPCQRSSCLDKRDRAPAHRKARTARRRAQSDLEQRNAMPLPVPDISRNLFDLGGYCSIVTGAGQGIGLALAEALAYAGSDLVLTERNAEHLAPARSRPSAAKPPRSPATLPTTTRRSGWSRRRWTSAVASTC
jgi:hypothetical protein